MIWLLLALHVAAIALAPAVGGRRALLMAAVAPAVTTVWAIAVAASSSTPVAEVAWVPGLDLEFRFEVDAVATLLTLLVSGVGALVLVYAAGYFSAPTGRFAATLLAFSVSMLGLVWADSVWTLFVFWELTSITSFLLIGQPGTSAAARVAARRALLITAGGGLVLLGALVVLVDEAGTARLSEMGPVSGTAAVVVAVLVLIAASTKSAQVPFHVWLPGAMVAPTPVSAYLHSATMVKAGVLLIALLGPVLGGLASWSWLGGVVGGATLLWGAIGALRHTDAKAILAWGTISQLGLMVLLFALGEPKATFAGFALLLAHGVFKAALFMVAGEIDVRTGTRDISALSGLWRSMPVAFGVAVVSAASMAGVPPLLGFTAKEAAIEAALGSSQRLLVSSVVVVGSTLTVAYTLRLVWGLFGPAGAGAPTPVAARRLAMTVPAVVLGGLSVVGFIALGRVNVLVGEAATQLDPEASVYRLLRWPGLTEGLVVSMAVIAVGLAVGAAAVRWPVPAPRALGAMLADASIDGLLRVSRRLAALVQHGSAPVYLATMAAVVALAATPFLVGIDLDSLRWADNWLQLVLVVLVLAAAAVSARVSSRLGAALGLGSVGLGVTGLFIVHGAPDLALTQLLVETVIVVGFVLGLGRLTSQFPPVGLIWRSVRLSVAALAGIAVSVAMIASASAPVADPPVASMAEQAVSEGGGDNVVNVILTDVRALDTLGEIVVLVVAAMGVLALAAAGRRGDVA